VVRTIVTEPARCRCVRSCRAQPSPSPRQTFDNHMVILDEEQPARGGEPGADRQYPDGPGLHPQLGSVWTTNETGGSGNRDRRRQPPRCGASRGSVVRLGNVRLMPPSPMLVRCRSWRSGGFWKNRPATLGRFDGGFGLPGLRPSARPVTLPGVGGVRTCDGNATHCSGV